MGYEMTPEMEEAVITLIDERIMGTTEEREQQTRRIDRLENALIQLADAQRRSEEAQRHMSHQLHILTDAVNKIQQTQVAMDKRLHTVENKVSSIDKRLHTVENNVAQMIGSDLERRYFDYAGSYLGRALRKVRAFRPASLEKELEAKLSKSDYQDFLDADLVVSGQPRTHKGTTVWLVMEISVVVDRRDVERAVQRAGYMRNAGYNAMPAVAGKKLTKGAETLVAQQVVVVSNGKIANFQEALARVLAS